ncbi:3-isopropylmalate dehydratase large subunit [candidate division KSB1 bacterium]|nr:3-isopropylmalate dehydratase large subunit [candidate division KSB1 bacterium]
MIGTFAEKILAQKAGLSRVRPGQIVTVKPDLLLTHDNTAAIIGKIGDDLKKYNVFDREKHIIVLDHVVPASSQKAAENHQKVRDYVKEYKIKHFYDVGEGICHQIVLEKGHAQPGMLILGSDSHTCTYGALNAFAAGIDRTEAAALLLTGETWLKVPHSIRIYLSGKLPAMVTAKDLILEIIGKLGADGANYCSVEYHGDVDHLNMEERMTIANMGVEMGAKNSVFLYDEQTARYLTERNIPVKAQRFVWADPPAVYRQTIDVEMDKAEPVVALPHCVDNVVPVTDVLGTPIHQFLLGTCTNGRLTDFETAAGILKGRHIAEGCRLLLLPASKSILQQTMASGAMQVLIEAGGMLLPPSCGPCLGAHLGVLAPGERCLSTANRNFKGRMGCAEAEIFLAGPQTIAWSAVHGKISDPRQIRS